VPARPGCTTPRIRFLFIAPRFCLGLPPDPASRRRPCPSANLRLCVHLVSGLAPDSLRAMPGTHRDREKPHGSPLPHHRAYGSRTRRFGRLSQPATLQTVACQPERLFSPCQRRLHPSQGTLRPVDSPDALPSFLSQRLLLSFNPLAGNRSGLRAPALRLGLSVAPPFGLECLTSFTCLPPTMPSADFSTVFSVSHPTPSLGPLRHRGDLPG
jgi:hypothetical protein